MKVLLVLLNTALTFALPSTVHPDYQNDIGEDDYNYPATEDTEDVSLEEQVNSDTPNFVSKGGWVYAQKGEKVELPCQVNHLGGRDMIWTKENGQEVPDQLFIIATRIVDDTSLQLRLLEGGEGTVLSISNLEDRHKGTYTCRIADRSVGRSLVFHLDVVEETSSPASQLVSSSCTQLLSAGSLIAASYLIQLFRSRVEL